MWEGEFEPWTSVGNTHLLATMLLAERSFHLNKHKKAINTTITANVHPSLGPGVQRSQKI